MAFGNIHRFEGVVNIVEFVEADMVIVRHIQRISLETTADFPEVPYGAAHAYKLDVGLHVVIPFDLLEVFGDVLFYHPRPFHAVGGGVGKFFGKRDRPERQGVLSDEHPSVVINEFYARSAYVHDDALGHVHGIYDGGINQTRLLFLAEYGKFYPATGQNFVHETLLVFRPSDSRRCVSKNSADIVTFVKILESFESFHHLLNSQRTQKSVYLHSFCKPDRLFQFVDNGKIPPLADIDYDYPRSIGTDVDNSYFFHKFLPSLFLAKKLI